jgi:hypothetical protein
MRAIAEVEATATEIAADIVIGKKGLGSASKLRTGLNLSKEVAEGAVEQTVKRTDDLGKSLLSRVRRLATDETGGITIRTRRPRTGRAEYRAYLNKKFGRTGNLHQDINLRGYLESVEKLDVSTAKGAAVFWSGPGNFARARSFARSTGKTLLEQTPGGIWLQNQAIFKRLPGHLAIKPWRALSRRFARGASGTINAFVRGARRDRTFYEVEFPELRKNPDVFRYIYRGY